MSDPGEYLSRQYSNVQQLQSATSVYILRMYSYVARRYYVENRLLGRSPSLLKSITSYKFKPLAIISSYILLNVCQGRISELSNFLLVLF